MRIAVARERADGERRVATVPEVVERLVAAGHSVAVEQGAGERAAIPDGAFLARGASIAPTAVELFAGVDLVARVRPPAPAEAATMPEGVALVSFLPPLAFLETVAVLSDRRVTAYSLDLLPRISRAQSMDALSSQATVAGYRAALIAAEHLPRFMPTLMTAAGTVPPATVLVLGTGVAGLQAIATARRLGAVVRANDVRPAAKEEVESLGATFVDLPLENQAEAGGYARIQSDEFLHRQRSLIATEVAKADAVITTAAVPGRRAPLLVGEEAVAMMRPGAVIVDLAAEEGGNCALSVAGDVVYRHGVTIVGARDLASSMPEHASYLYAHNVASFVELVAQDGAYAPDAEDELVAGTCVTRDGIVLHGPTRAALGGGAAAAS